MVPTALRYIKQMPIGSRGYYWRVHKKMDSIFCRALSEKNWLYFLGIDPEKNKSWKNTIIMFLGGSTEF